MLAGKQTTINGDGSIVRDVVYVGDVARANLLALQTDLSPPFSALNIGTGEPTTVGDLAAGMRALCAAERSAAGHNDAIPAPWHGPDRAGDLKSSLVDASLAARLLGWKPSTSLESGLRQTVEWFAKAAGAQA
jgi:UDP-glucose 4-epimerase